MVKKFFNNKTFNCESFYIKIIKYNFSIINLFKISKKVIIIIINK